MKLFWSSRSPFVRKVMVFAHETGLADRIERTQIIVAPTRPNPEVMALNPLNKLPTLILDDGRALYDAMEKMPEATNLYAPKIHETVVGIAPYSTPIFAQRCAEVEARGVKLGRGPVPNAN